MNPLRRFADARLRSELSAQKAANKQLHKALRFQQCRANGLAINLKTHKKRLAEARKQLREAQAETTP